MIKPHIHSVTVKRPGVCFGELYENSLEMTRKLRSTFHEEAIVSIRDERVMGALELTDLGCSRKEIAKCLGDDWKPAKDPSVYVLKKDHVQQKATLDHWGEGGSACITSRYPGPQGSNTIYQEINPGHLEYLDGRAYMACGVL